MGWKSAPGRFLMDKRRWIPAWRFQPLQKIDDAFQVLHSAGVIEYVLFAPGDVIEIRALAVGRSPSHPGSTSSGYFNFENRDAIARAIKQLDGHAEGVYVVLNRFNPDLLARANNRLQAKPKHTTSDAD